MALAIDTEMPSNAGQSSTASSSLTYSFNNAAGTLLVIGVSWGSAAAFAMSGVTYNTVAMTQVTGAVVGYDGAGHNFSGAALYFLLTPATSAHNVVVSMTGTPGGSTAILSGGISFTGHDLVTPIVASSGKSNFQESGTTSATVGSATTTSGNIVLAQMATGSGYSSTTQSRSWSLNVNGLSAGGNGALTRAAGTGSTITMTDTITSDFFGMVCCEIAAASGGATRGLFRTPPLSGAGVGGSFFRDPLQGRMVRRDRIYVPARMSA